LPRKWLVSGKCGRLFERNHVPQLAISLQLGSLAESRELTAESSDSPINMGQAARSCEMFHVEQFEDYAQNPQILTPNHPRFAKDEHTS
jgi:hypothetical protein